MKIYKLRAKIRLIAVISKHSFQANYRRVIKRMPELIIFRF